MADHDQLRLGVAAAGDGGERSHAGAFDLGAAPDLDFDARERPGAVGQRGRRQYVGGCVLEVARGVGRFGGDGRALDLGARVVVRGDDQLVEARAVVVLALVHAVLVGGQQRPLHEAAGLDVMGNLPAQRSRAQLLGAGRDRRGGHPGALVVEIVALAESGEHVAPAAGVGHGDLAERRAGFASIDQVLQDSVDVVGDLLALEDADGDRVGPGVRRGICRGSYAHRNSMAVCLAP